MRAKSARVPASRGKGCRSAAPMESFPASVSDRALSRRNAPPSWTSSGLRSVPKGRAAKRPAARCGASARSSRSGRFPRCASGIRNDDGSLLFQNDLHARFFGGDAWSGSQRVPAGREPQPCLQGDRHWLVNSFEMVGSDQRRLHGFTALDVSERVRAENEHRKTTQLLDSIMQNLPVIVGRIAADGRVVEASGRGLEHAGLLASRWSEVNGRRRRVYQLTAKGQKSLASRHDEWQDFSRAVQSVVGGLA